MNIPIIICGEVKEGQNISLSFDGHKGKSVFTLPKVNDSDIEKIRACKDLDELSVDEIISFYDKLGKLWGRKNYDLKKDAIELTEIVTGLHRKMVEHTFDFIPYFCNKKTLEIRLETELGGKRYLDGWLPKYEAEVHALPRGKILHIMAGNVPIVGAMSLLRGTLTKNANILKLPSRDIISSLYFALSYKDIDEDHPILKTTSVVYWKGGSDIEDKFLSFCDAVNVWGGKQAVEAIRKKAPYGVELLEFGPKKSIQLIKVDGDIHKVADEIAHDISLYDQEACHSPQEAFVEGDVDRLVKVLIPALEEQLIHLPKGYMTIDQHATVSHERLMAKFRGDKVHHPKGTEWTVIVSDDPEKERRHPLSRTIYIYPVKKLEQALNYVNRATQTVGVHPRKLKKRYREELTKRGVDRVTDVGKMGYFALGAPHDGIYPLSRMVRWVKSRRD